MTAKEFGTKGPRSLYPEMCDSTSLGRCSILTNALWPRIVISCDDQGRMAGNAADVLGECFPKMLAKVRIKDVEISLAELALARAVIRYKVNGEDYLQVRSWWAWQQYARRAYPSRMPTPDGWSDYVYGRVGDTYATWRDAAGLAARQSRGLHPENIYDDVSPGPTDWPEPQDLDDANRSLTASEPQPNRTVPLAGDSLLPLARAQSRPVPSRPVPSTQLRDNFSGAGDEMQSLMAEWGVAGLPLSGKWSTQLDRAVEKIGETAVQGHLERIRATGSTTTRQFMLALEPLVNPVPNLKPLDPVDNRSHTTAEDLRRHRQEQAG